MSDFDEAEDVSDAGPVEDVVDDLVYDIFNLTACNYHPLRLTSDTDLESEILTTLKRTTQALVNKYADL